MRCKSRKCSESAEAKLQASGLQHCFRWTNMMLFY